VGSICGKVSHAQSAVRAGVDFVIVQGAEGGGHTGNVGLSVLLPLVVDEVGHKVPVIAAGGIYDGRGMASALCYGAQGVWVGTRFMMSPEAKTSEEYKSRLIKASSDDTCVTKAYTGATMRVLRNPYVTKYEENPKLLEANSALIARRAWADGVWKIHSGDAKNFDESNQAVVTGQNIGAMDSLKPCADIVRDMNKEAWTVLKDLSAKVKTSKSRL
jgi:enoyl-[acyl-carrier protein] reductase II